VERRRQLGLELEQGLLGGALGGVRIPGRDVDLGAVARREADHLASDLLGEPPCQRRRVVARERGPLPQLDGRAMVRGADEDEVHAKWVTGRASRTTTTSANPAITRYAPRRPRQPAR